MLGNIFKRWTSLHEPRRFSYRPIYYDPAKDPELREKMRAEAMREGRLDPLTQGISMREKMQGRDPLLESLYKYDNSKQKRLMRLIFIAACTAYVLWVF